MNESERQTIESHINNLRNSLTSFDIKIQMVVVEEEEQKENGTLVTCSTWCSGDDGFTHELGSEVVYFIATRLANPNFPIERIPNNDN